MTARAKYSFWYLLIALLLPALFLLSLELTLRLSDVAAKPKFFIESNDFPGYLQPNPQLLQRYFPNQSLPLSPDSQFFKAQKAKGVFRIVVQGESSAAGFPYGRWGSLQALLSQRFKRTYPDQQIEVINTAMAAVSSYNLLDFADDIIQLQPDLVLIYAGHNEYLGLFGVASRVHNPGQNWLTQLHLTLLDWHVYRLLNQWLAPGNPLLTSPDSAEPLMAKLAAGHRVPLDSALYQAGLQQFSENLHALADIYRQAAVPVMIGTLISNEADQPPLAVTSQSDWAQLSQTPAQADFQQLLAQQPAAAAYWQGQQALLHGDTTKAVQSFSHARDLDELRFRAPAAFNRIIRELAHSQGLYLVDVEQALRSQYPLFDRQLFLEHVHLNSYGYFLLAEQFYQAIVHSGLLGPEQQQVETNVALQDIPLSPLDLAYAALKIDKLHHAPPFVPVAIHWQPKLPQQAWTTLLQQRLQGDNWLRVQQQLLQLLLTQQQWPQAARVAVTLAEAVPEQAEFLHQAGLIYLNLNELALADYYLSRAVLLETQQSRYLLNLAQVRFLRASYSSSLELLRQAQALSPDDKRIQSFIDKVKQQQQPRQGPG
ncbi:SGNH/GDSL hydrolase family protein [Rheinheimera sp.]|uniref:SGNH/GDSL hydrolase family protein n=1 Tax=Rheinheimera sp. TaxID=1869214 RepID=UPI00307DBFC4